LISRTLLPSWHVEATSRGAFLEQSSFSPVVFRTRVNHMYLTTIYLFLTMNLLADKEAWSFYLLALEAICHVYLSSDNSGSRGFTGVLLVHSCREEKGRRSKEEDVRCAVRPKSIDRLGGMRISKHRRELVLLKVDTGKSTNKLVERLCYLKLLCTVLPS
jgi:hypothetical protein